MPYQDNDITNYLEIVFRRKRLVFVPFFLIFGISIALAFGLPAIYQSKATILIEQQEIPQDLVRSTVTSYAAERIQVISKRIMTRQTLWGIVEKFDLYRDKRKSVDKGDLIALAKENISVEMVSADIRDPRSGRAGKATIAFEISFDNEDPLAAKSITSELVGLFLKENKLIRTQKAVVTAGFLAEEADRLNVEILALESKLASYKEKNIGQLPELMQLNMNLMERSERELEDTRRNLSVLEERKLTLETKLLHVSPNTGESPQGRLVNLQGRYLALSSRYSLDHPDVVKLRREIENLKTQTGVKLGDDSIRSEINEVQQRLMVLQEKYSAQHPDVVKLTKLVEHLQSQLKEGMEQESTGLSVDLIPDNPAYISLQTQLDVINIQIKSLTSKRDRQKEKRDSYEQRLIAMPSVEQEGLSIRRDYDNAVKKYHEIRQKQLQAQVGEQLEKESKGERFTLLDSPIVPTKPIKPNRLGIVLLGFFLSVSSGIGFAAFAEYFDKSVRGAKGVARLLGAPPLTVVPLIINAVDRKSGFHKRIRRVILVSIFLSVLLYLVHIYIMPIDTWFNPA